MRRWIALGLVLAATTGWASRMPPQSLPLGRDCVYESNASGIPVCTVPIELTIGSGLTYDPETGTLSANATGTFSLTTFTTAQAPAAADLDGYHRYRLGSVADHVAFTLPEAASGLAAELQNVDDNKNLTLTPYSYLDVFTIDGTASVNAGYAVSLPKGLYQLRATGTNAWDVWTVAGGPAAEGADAFTAALTPSPASPYTFTDTSVGQERETPFTFGNTGTDAATVTGVSLVTTGQGYTIKAGGTCVSASPIAPLSSCTETVVYAPAGAATHTDTLRVAVSGVGNVDVALSGTGLGGFAYLYEQDFEGATESSMVTATAAGTVDDDHTPALEDAADLLITANAGSGQVIRRCSPIFTGAGTVHGYLRFKASGTSAYQGVLQVRDSGGNMVSQVRWLAGSSNLYLAHGATTSLANAVHTAGTEYHLWLDYTKGTGTDGAAAYYIATTGTKPGSPTRTIANGTATADAAQVCVFAENAATIQSDHWRVSTDVIGSDPE
jgi:hypothetical protein